MRKNKIERNGLSLRCVQYDNETLKYCSRDDFVRVHPRVYLKKDVGDFNHFLQTSLGLKMKKRLVCLKFIDISCRYILTHFCSIFTIKHLFFSNLLI